MCADFVRHDSAHNWRRSPTSSRLASVNADNLHFSAVGLASNSCNRCNYVCLFTSHLVGTEEVWEMNVLITLAVGALGLVSNNFNARWPPQQVRLIRTWLLRGRYLGTLCFSPVILGRLTILSPLTQTGCALHDLFFHMQCDCLDQVLPSLGAASKRAEK